MHNHRVLGIRLNASYPLFGDVLGGPGLLLLGRFFAPASEIKKSENQKSKNGASQIISVTRHNSGTNHRYRKLKTLFLKDMRSSEFP